MNKANDASKALVAILEIVHDVCSMQPPGTEAVNCECPSHKVFYI